MHGQDSNNDNMRQRKLSALDSPSGSGLRGARSLALSNRERLNEMATLRAKSKRAAREANTLRERMHQIETQYELRLQITLQRGEERQSELSQLIKQQKTDLQTLEKRREFQVSRYAKETAGLKSENNKLRSEIAEKQKSLERSIAQRHTVEESLVEMSRWFRKKGKSTDQIPINELLNRLSSTKVGSAGAINSSRPGRDGVSRSGIRSGSSGGRDGAEVERGATVSDAMFSSSIFGSGSVSMQQPQQVVEAELERINVQAEQTAADYQHALHVNETLQEELLGAKAAASESSAAVLRVQAESRDAIMDIAARASKQLKHQQERCNSLEATVQELQAQMNEEHGSHLDAVKTLEADLLAARQTVREKELELDTYERKYSTLKAEFDEFSERKRSKSGEFNTNNARPQTAEFLASGTNNNAASAPRLLLPSRDAYIAWAN
jgi:chromosome segregation ATPase